MSSQGVQPLALRLTSVMLGKRVVASSTKDTATAAIMRRLGEYFPGDKEMEDNVRFILREIPGVLSLENITDAEETMGIFCHDWTKKQTHSMAMLVYKRGTIRLYILDWGFATKSNEVSSFFGIVVIASDHVLEQLNHQKNCALTRTSVAPYNELLSLVRCLFSTFHFHLSSKLQQVHKEPEMLLSFWKHHMECSLFWSKEEDDALHLRYESSKHMLSNVLDT